MADAAYADEEASALYESMEEYNREIELNDQSALSSGEKLMPEDIAYSIGRRHEITTKE